VYSRDPDRDVRLVAIPQSLKREVRFLPSLQVIQRRRPVVAGFRIHFEFSHRYIIRVVCAALKSGSFSQKEVVLVVVLLRRFFVAGFRALLSSSSSSSSSCFVNN